jgi:hypothetical protein
MNIRILLVIALQSTLVFTSFSVLNAESAQFRVRENNLYAPNLYADKVDFVATLVDLPGAKKTQSSWELSYQLFFIPEDKYWETVRHLPRGGSNPTPEQFPGRILLAEGHKKKMHLSAPQARTIALDGVALKEKVPDALRTKFAVLMTSYAVKIFDAELNTTIYHSGIFLTDPYEEDEQKQAVPRRTIYLNFAVTPDGTLNYSQLRRKAATAQR